MTTPAPAKKPSAEARAAAYAEEELGVHTAHEEANDALASLSVTHENLADLRNKKRDLEARLQDREMEIAADERGRHPDMSAAAMEKHLKVALNNDDSVREFREQISRVIGEIDDSEYHKAELEFRIKIAVSRMQELGGYLQFLAAVKLNPTKPVTPKETA